MGGLSSIWPQTHGNQYNTRESTLTAPLRADEGLDFEVWIDYDNAIHHGNVGSSIYSSMFSLYMALTAFEFETIPYYQVSSFVFDDDENVNIMRGKNVIGWASVIPNSSLELPQAPLFTRPNANMVFPPRSPYIVSYDGFIYTAHGNTIFKSSTSDRLNMTLEEEVDFIEQCSQQWNVDLESDCEWIESLWIQNGNLYIMSNYGNAWNISEDLQDASMIYSSSGGRVNGSLTSPLIYNEFTFIAFGGSLLKIDTSNSFEVEVIEVTDGILITSPQLIGEGDDGTPYVLVLDDASPTIIYVIDGSTGNIVDNLDFMINGEASKIVNGIQPVTSNFGFILPAGVSEDWIIPIEVYKKVCYQDEATYEICFTGLAAISAGVVKYVFDPISATIEIDWVNRNVSCPGSSGTVSADESDDQKIYYCIGATYAPRGVVGMTTLEALNWSTGESIFQHNLGRHSLITPAISEVVIGPQNAIYYGANGGIGRIEVSSGYFVPDENENLDSANNLAVALAVVGALIFCVFFCLLSGRTRDWYNQKRAKYQSSKPLTDYSLDTPTSPEMKVYGATLKGGSSSEEISATDHSKYSSSVALKEDFKTRPSLDTIKGNLELPMPSFTPTMSKSRSENMAPLPKTSPLFSKNQSEVLPKFMGASKGDYNLPKVSPFFSKINSAKEIRHLRIRSSFNSSHSFLNSRSNIMAQLGSFRKLSNEGSKESTKWDQLNRITEVKVANESEEKTSKSADTLSWDKISISTKKGEKKVLKGLSGCIQSGDMWAIMGPSGCGKTTLLNILAGRTNSMTYLANYRGRCAINTVHVNASLRIRLAAYVRQEDVFFPELSVQEVLTFAAKLKLPVSDFNMLTNTTDPDKPGIIQKLMTDLDLAHIAEVRVGDTMKKGISGGEKKRLSIGIELVTQPTMIFLDEPTSGLDSVSTFKVCKILKRLCEESNCIIMATIHQPSHKTFELFSHVYLMRAGLCVYAHPREELLPILQKMGHNIPANTNPAEFALETVLEVDDTEFATMVRACSDRNYTSWNKLCRNMTSREDLDMGLTQRLREFETGRMQSTWIQIKNLLSRAWMRRLRVRGPSLAILIQPIIIFLFQGILALRTAQYETIEVLDSTSYGGSEISVSEVCSVAYDVCPVEKIDGISKSVETRDYYVVYALITVVIFMISINAANSTILTIPTETPIRTREIQSNMYTAMPYVFAKMIIELPITTLFFIGGFSLVYLMVPFYAPFWKFAGIIALHSCASIGLAWLISTIARNPRAALQLSNLAFAPQILFSGLMVKVKDIPSSLRWISYCCYLKYSINLAVIIELEDDPLATDYLDHNLIDKDMWITYICVLICFFLFCIFSTIYTINRRNLGASLDLGVSADVLTIRDSVARNILSGIIKVDSNGLAILGDESSQEEDKPDDNRSRDL